MIHLKNDTEKYSFYCIRNKSVEITEATIRYTFEDDESKRTYLVFNTAGRPNEYVLKEYLGELSDRRFRRADNSADPERIYELLVSELSEKARRENTEAPRIVLCV